MEGILASIRELGYAVSVHRMGEYIEMHAVELKNPEMPHIARIDRDDDDAAYQCATELARMVGIQLKDG